MILNYLKFLSRTPWAEKTLLESSNSDLGGFAATETYRIRVFSPRNINSIVYAVGKIYIYLLTYLLYFLDEFPRFKVVPDKK